MKKLIVFYFVLVAVKFTILLGFNFFHFLNQDLLKFFLYGSMLGDVLLSVLLFFKLRDKKIKALIGFIQFANWLVTLLIFAANILPAKNPYM